MIANPLCSKDKGGSNEILSKIDVTMLTLTVLCFVLKYFEHMQSDAVIKLLHNIAFVTDIYNVLSLSAKLKGFCSSKIVLTEYKKRDSFTRKVPLQLKRFSRKVLTDTTNFVRITTVILFLTTILIVIVYDMIFVVNLLLKFI